VARGASGPPRCVGVIVRLVNQALARSSWRFPGRRCLQVRGCSCPRAEEVRHDLAGRAHAAVLCGRIESQALWWTAARQAHGSFFMPGRARVGESSCLCCRDAEVLFEVSGELVGAEVAVRGDDVFDGCHGQRRILQATVAFLQA
jgi:hypothetical protein